MTTTWQDAVEDAVHDAAQQHGLDPDELLDVELNDEGQPIGDGIDFVLRLDSLADADPTDETFAQAVADEVASYAAELQADPIAAAATYDTAKHPHKGAGPGGGQFSTTDTAPAPRKPLTYSGVRQGTGKYSKGGKGGSASAQLADVIARTTLKNDGKGNDPAAVMQLQNLINELKLGGLTVNGTYGDSTEAAVKAIQAKLGLAQTGNASPALIRRVRDAHALSPCVDKGASQVAAAAGHDVTPGHDELHHYWTKGKGLARWINSPTPWTTLVALLSEHVPLEKAKVFASKWLHEVTGLWAGSDAHRVAHGHPPRGKVIGPG